MHCFAPPLPWLGAPLLRRPSCSGARFMAEAAHPGWPQVWPGDICVLGTDGLFDNVSDDEILQEVRRSRARSAIQPQKGGAFNPSKNRYLLKPKSTIS